MSAVMTILSLAGLKVSAVEMVVFTSPNAPLSAPKRISLLHENTELTPFKKTGFARTAVRPDCSLLLKRTVPALITISPSQVLADGPTTGATKVVPKRNVQVPFLTSFAIPEIFAFAVARPAPEPETVIVASIWKGVLKVMPPAPSCTRAGSTPENASALPEMV